MSFIKKKDLQILIKVESLLYEKLKETNSLNNNYEYDLWLSYYNIVENIINDINKLNKRSNEWNKKNKDYHRIMNNLYDSKKRNNKEKINYWTNELLKLKESKGEI